MYLCQVLREGKGRRGGREGREREREGGEGGKERGEGGEKEREGREGGRGREGREGEVGEREEGVISRESFLWFCKLPRLVVYAYILVAERLYGIVGGGVGGWSLSTTVTCGSVSLTGWVSK